MASSSTSVTSQPVVFSTQTPYPLPSQKFMIPVTWKRYQLSQLINKALSLSNPVPFDFLVRKEVLLTTIGEWCAENGVGEEETLDIEYIESVMPPQKMSDFPHEDWVSSVSCKLQGYLLTASYDGHVRSFDYSKNVISTAHIHTAPITSMCIVPSSISASSHIIASASHDLTAQLTEITLDPITLTSASSVTKAKPLATLHLHTAPLSSIASNTSGSHLLTSSWDSLIGFWDTNIPSTDEVPEEMSERERKRRRKTKEGEKVKRKAPLLVLKSHTSRVSMAAFGSGTHNQAVYSCGFDSTVRSWDVEHGICIQTISAAEKPFLDLAVTEDGNTLLAASTDRTMTLYDLRMNSSTASMSPTAAASFSHPATPSCLALGSSGSHQVISGAYDGVVRLWDLRSVKGAMASFKVWDGAKKILCVDWTKGVAAVGGEGGLGVWKVGEERLYI